MKNIFVSLIFTLILSSLSAQAQEKPADLIHWMSFEEALQNQEENPKPILI